MPITPARPDLSTLSLRVYDRAIHPELYPCSVTARIQSGDFRCVLSLGEAGHVILVTLAGESACETLLESSIALPQRGLQLQTPLACGQEASLELAGVFRWQTQLEFETYDAEGYIAAHERWEADARRACLSRAFECGHRLKLPAGRAKSKEPDYAEDQHGEEIGWLGHGGGCVRIPGCANISET